MFMAPMRMEAVAAQLAAGGSDKAAAGESHGPKAKKLQHQDETEASFSNVRCIQLVSAEKICEALQRGSKRGGRDALLGEDPLDMFFESMCETTRRLPLPYQAAIKREISEIVFRTEEQHFLDQNYRKQIGEKPSWPCSPQGSRELVDPASQNLLYSSYHQAKKTSSNTLNPTYHTTPASKKSSPRIV